MKESKLEIIFDEKFNKIKDEFTEEIYDIFEEEIKNEATKLGFDEDLFEIGGEFLEEDGSVSPKTQWKRIYCFYNSDDAFIMKEWY